MKKVNRGVIQADGLHSVVDVPETTFSLASNFTNGFDLIEGVP